MVNLNKHTKTRSEPKWTCKFNNCWHMCVSLCTTVVHNTTQNSYALAKARAGCCSNKLIIGVLPHFIRLHASIIPAVHLPCRRMPLLWKADWVKDNIITIITVAAMARAHVCVHTCQYYWFLFCSCCSTMSVNFAKLSLVYTLRLSRFCSQYSLQFLLVGVGATVATSIA